MKIFRHIIIALACSLTAMAFTGCDDAMRLSIPKKPVVLKPKKGSVRPNDPDLYETFLYDALDCRVSNGYIEVDFPDGMEYLDYTISSSTRMEWHGTLTAVSPSAEFPTLLPGTYTLDIETDYGEIYGCDITL